MAYLSCVFLFMGMNGFQSNRRVGEVWGLIQFL